MSVADGSGKSLGAITNDNNSFQIDRRDLLLAAGTTVTVGLDAAISSKAKAAIESAGTKIDAHTHFSPPKFLEFAEQAEGRPFPLTPLYKSLPALTEVRPRTDLLDRNGIDMNDPVPVPWIEGFPKISADRTLAAQAAKLMNDELAAVIATNPTRGIASGRHAAGIRWPLMWR